MKRTALVLLAFSVFQAHAEVYKWVDENGEVHYGAGTSRPIKAESEKVHIQKSSAPKQLTGEAKAMAESFAQEVLKDKGDAEELDCKKAVFNARDSLDTMLSVGEKNYKDGYIKEADYKKTSAELKKIQARVSLSECQSARGDVKGFYLCMSNDYNHVATCGKKYNYGS